MTVKEYLAQTWRINRLIDAKLEQVRTLRELAAKATSTLSPTPPSETRNVHRMEDIIAKMLDLENEINFDIDKLVDLKRDIANAIRSLNSPDYRVLLELRYLCFKTWDEIAADFHCSVRHVHRIHGEALAACSERVKDVTIIC
jgi:DNA-directed RNA polymerase specialized sigma24 family protein